MDSRAAQNTTSEFLVPGSVALAFLFACHYYDPGLNLALLFYALIALGIALAFVGSRQMAAALAQNVYLGLGCLFSLVALALHHLFISVSPDSSFAPSLVLATLPIMALLTAASDGQRIFYGVFLCVFAMALYAAFAYLAWGERASGTLFDPNNFATLLYLVWIPWLHAHLDPAHSPWRIRGRPLTPLVRTTAIGLVVAVFALALLATHSRFTWLVLVGVSVYWGLLSIRQHIHWPTFIASLIGILLASALYMGLGVEELQANLRSVVGAGTEDQSVRWLLVESAWEMVRALGGHGGTGIYTFSLFYPQYRSVLEQSTSGLFVHNDYLQILLEGGVLVFLPLMILVGVIVLLFLRGSFKRGHWDPGLGRLAALGMAILHANLNFVFYVLPLSMLLGVLVGLSLANAKTVAAAASTRSLRWLVRGSMLFGLSCLAFLLLDVFNYGVFSGQKGLPGTDFYRQDADRMLSAAQLSQRLNKDRGIPYLAEALLLERKLATSETLEKADASQVTSLQQQRVAQKFAEAVRIDPWNPQAYISYARFVQSHDVAVDSESLIMRAFELKPQNVDAALLAIDHFVAAGDVQKAQDIARQAGLWCKDIGRRDPKALDRLGRRMTTLYEQTQSESLAQTLDRCRESRQSVVKGTPARSWLMEWLNRV